MATAAQFDFDLIVIGGGSGGMATAKEAARLGARVALFDYVKPSSQGTTWGLGGTCVNVGCVPKKLMHYAGLLGAGFHDAKAYGWKVHERPEHDWEELVSNVQNHVHMLNFRYRVGLKSADVTYFNALATFVDAHTVVYQQKGEEKRVSAETFVIAVGGRPYVPDDVPGALEHAITSDDVFSLDRRPGKTLCVGGSYIALECAGFLNELGYDVTVSARSILLRGFDRQCAEKIGSLMQDLGTKIEMRTVPTSITKKPNGKLDVVLTNSLTGAEKLAEFDTVLFAVGRVADVKQLGLEHTGVHVNEDGKIPVTNEQTNVPHIYAVGDVCEGKLELTPVAVQAGELLARRLYAGSTVQMDYDMVPTTVFTPFEYGSVGLSEEVAIQRYGAENIETYLFEFSTLELQAAHRVKHTRLGEEEDLDHVCLSKLVCLKTEEERVVGFHFVGPNAGEVTQGFALAVRLGAKKRDFDTLVGIHPTDAESFCAMSVTRSSGMEWKATGGCGGGVCG